MSSSSSLWSACLILDGSDAHPVRDSCEQECDYPECQPREPSHNAEREYDDEQEHECHRDDFLYQNAAPRRCSTMTNMNPMIPPIATMRTLQMLMTSSGRMIDAANNAKNPMTLLTARMTSFLSMSAMMTMMIIVTSNVLISMNAMLFRKHPPYINGFFRFLVRASSISCFAAALRVRVVLRG